VGKTQALHLGWQPTAGLLDNYALRARLFRCHWEPVVIVPLRHVLPQLGKPQLRPAKYPLYGMARGNCRPWGASGGICLSERLRHGSTGRGDVDQLLSSSASGWGPVSSAFAVAGAGDVRDTALYPSRRQDKGEGEADPEAQRPARNREGSRQQELPALVCRSGPDVDANGDPCEFDHDLLAEGPHGNRSGIHDGRRPDALGDSVALPCLGDDLSAGGEEVAYFRISHGLDLLSTPDYGHWPAIPQVHPRHLPGRPLYRVDRGRHFRLVSSSQPRDGGYGPRGRGVGRGGESR